MKFFEQTTRAERDGRYIPADVAKLMPVHFDAACDMLKRDDGGPLPREFVNRWWKYRGHFRQVQKQTPTPAKFAPIYPPSGAD
jgi:hypothetical protein